MGMGKTRRRTLADDLRRFIAADPRTMYRIAADAGLTRGVLSRFMGKERDLTLETADRLCEALGLQLIQKGR